MVKLIRNIIIIFSVCFSKNIYSQTSAYWSIGSDNIFHFKDSTLIEQHNLNFFNNGSAGAIVSRSNGNALMFHNVFNVKCFSKSKTIKNGDSIVFVPYYRSSSFFQRNDSIYDLINFYDTFQYGLGFSEIERYYKNYKKRNGYLFDTLKNFKNGFYLQKIKVSSNGIEVLEKNKLIIEKSNTKHHIYSISRVSDYKYRILSGFSGDYCDDKIYILDLYDGNLKLKDSILLPNPATLFKEPIFIKPNKRNYRIQFKFVKLNFSQDKLFFTLEAVLGTDTSQITIDLINYSGLFYVDIDPVYGKILSTPKEILKFQQPIDGIINKSPNGKYYKIHDLVFSPNDSILYFMETEQKIDSIERKRNFQFTHRLKAWKYRKESSFNPETVLELHQKTQDYGIEPTISINPFGLLTILYINKYFWGLNGIKFLILNETNKPKGLLSSFKSFETNGGSYSVRVEPAHFLYDFVRLDSKNDYSCEAKVSFQNRSDLSGGMKDFTWYFMKERGKTDTIIGFEPEIIYTKSGDYPFKVHGYSPRGKGYGEWYIDTVHIRIPPKPIASFKAVDTVICRYLPLKFINQSSAKELKQGTQEKYVWTFGDGSTSYDREPTHTYTQTGVYTVSLFYSNGYCDSTLVKNQYIRVVDAPKPGFNTAVVQGCVPFTAAITDTVSLNVTKKEYLFSDSSVWHTILSSSIYHTFYKAGHYWAVQKLYGNTGCIIRTDSVQFFVSKGILPSDSLAIVSASFDTSNNLRIEWQSHQAAVSYNVYRSARGTSYKIIANTENTNYIDSLCREQAFYYKVKAVDSCGKLTQSLNEVKPHYITTKRLKLNQAAIIEHQAAQGMGVEQNLILQSSSDFAINLALEQTNPLNPYRDENFTISGYLRKCYRIQAEHNGKKVYSNYECINYEPLVYIPNAFSPNGDGNNEVFKPSVIGIISYELKIFNRWGQLIYKGNTSWDGTISGKTAEQGVYFFNLRLSRNDLQNEIHSGMVHLLR
ncbi:MAG: gliding motility-associated C-terminal domain-containing protein [Bacteroidia bacterium]|nr:gliding motility-associated C-terminal domain-containing protein [Bacteroidia bacterium]